MQSWAECSAKEEIHHWLLKFYSLFGIIIIIFFVFVVSEFVVDDDDEWMLQISLG